MQEYIYCNTFATYVIDTI